ncbi:hypothetical protein RRG08_034327 [Elysia crispata]|uniref:7TM GPCR serpentine receptor class x (Srx) domain-containing protein n=1 Tax=Elysia crispata TaxID=231223 RepID=A0AAE1AGX9_9GAST|nr:hypothetical protein RRG08_034327 [Elysia crispata]
MLTGLNATLAPESYEKPYKREYDIFVTIVYPIFPVLLLAGLITNTLNIVTFLKAGVKDSVATLLLTISISDAIFLCFFAPVALRRGFSSLGANKNRVLYEMFLILFWPAFTMYDFSAYTTIFLGVTRCACVAMPLKFKSVFTRKRTVISVIVLFCIDVLFHIPVLSIFTLKWKTDAQRNTTYLSVSFVGDRIDAAYKQTLNDIINKNTLQAVSITMIITCAALLSFKLYESSKVRSKPVQDPGSGEANPKTSHHLSPKDVRVVQSAILVIPVLRHYLESKSSSNNLGYFKYWIRLFSFIMAKRLVTDRCAKNKTEKYYRMKLKVQISHKAQITHMVKATCLSFSGGIKRAVDALSYFIHSQLILSRAKKLSRCQRDLWNQI